MTTTMNDSFTSATLTDSVGSLPSSRLLLGDRSLSSSSPAAPSSPKRTLSPLSKIYKQASTLFLTRRLAEAYQLLQPLVTPPPQQDLPPHRRTGSTDVAEVSGQRQRNATAEAAPVAAANRSVRVKIWSLYLTLLNAIVELSPEEGKSQLGGQLWKGLVAKVRDGSIWEDVVRHGYAGEAEVDPEVVANLATLLLSNSPSQELNQLRLESYLSSNREPQFDLSGQFNSAGNPTQQPKPRAKRPNGTDTPRDLESRIKILELFALHVLPRNSEWQYARDFITSSEILDEERREDCLQTLQNLEDQSKEQTQSRAGFLDDVSQDLQEQPPRPVEERHSPVVQTKGGDAGLDIDENATLRSKRHRKSGSEVDYGIDDRVPRQAIKATETAETKTGARQTSDAGVRAGYSRKSTTSRKTNRVARKTGAGLFVEFRQLAIRLTRSLLHSPTSVMRVIVFLIALLLAIAQPRIRERVARMLGTSWQKLRGTVGMGMKVSYI